MIQGMTKNLCEDFGLPPTLFTMFDYNIMISLPGLKDYFLKSIDAKEIKDAEDRMALEKKNSQSSIGNNGKSRFLENFKDKFALIRQPTGKSDRSGNFGLTRSKRQW